MKQTILFTIAFGVIIAVFAGIADLEQVAYTTSVLSLPDTTIELSFWIYDGKTESEPLLRETRSVEVRDSRVELDFDPGILAPESVYFVDILAGDDVISNREPLSRPMEPMAVGLQIGKTTEELEILSSRVGIGTTSPSTQLHTTGGVRFAGIGGSGTHLTIDGTGNITRTTISGTVSGSGTNNYISRWTPDGTTLGNSSIWNDGTYVRVIQSSASPVGARFYVQGAPVTTSGSEFLAHIRLAGGSNHYGVLRLEDGGAANALGPVLEVQKYGTGPSATFTGGNVGIGTAAPAHPLHVHGPNTATVLKVSHDIHSGTPAISVGQTSSDKFTVSSTGQITVSSAHSGGNHITVRDGSTMLVKDAQLLFADGSTAAPAYSFISDLNTGIYRPASDQLAFSTAGSERVRVNASGNVGIGTTSPSDRLHVSGGNLRVSNHVDSGNMIYLDDSNNSTGENAHHAIHVQTQGTVQSYLSTNGDSYFSGNMGLGTTSPSTQLHTTGGVRFAGIGGSGSHLTIDGSGNITRTTIPTGTNYWTDHGTYLSPADGEAVYSDGEFYTPSAYGVFHWGNTGIGGQASGWDPPNSDGTGGVWLENTYGEGGGFYADANVACIWSPDYGVRFYDEDALPSGTHNAAIENNGYMTSPRFQDIDNTVFYLDPASTSYLNDVRASIVYDRDNTTYYLNPAGTSRLQYLQNDYYISNPSANYSGAVAFADHIVPTSNGGYDLGQSSYRWRNLWVNGIYLNGDYRNSWPAALPSGSTNQTLYYNGSSWVANSVFTIDASNSRTGTSASSTNDLYICDYIYDWDNTGYYIDINGTSRMNRINIDYLYSYNWVYGSMFYDVNNSSYYLDPASTSYLNDVRASIVYDRDNTSYYSNPNSASRFNTIYSYYVHPWSNGAYDLGNSSYRWRNLWVNGIYLNGVYRDSWPGSDNLGNHTATMDLNMNGYSVENARKLDFSYDYGTYATEDGVLYRYSGQACMTVDDWFYMYDTDGSRDIEFNIDDGSIRPRRLYDLDNTGYYIDMNGTSNVYAFYRNRGFNGVEYDVNNTSYYVDPNAVSIFNDMRANIYYDYGNTGYYLDPNSTSNLNILRAYRYRDNAGDYLIRAGTGITVSEDTDGSYLISSSGGGGSNWTITGSNIYRNSSITVGTTSCYDYRKIYAYHNQLTANGDGQAAVYAHRTRDSRNDGTSYTNSGTNNGVEGYTYWGDVYTFGVHGQSYCDYTRSGGVCGYGGGSWGSLGYKTSSSSYYGGYFSSYTSGGGRRRPSYDEDGTVFINNGVGAWGDLFGADFHGTIYGSYAEGGHYATYAHGDRYGDGLDVHLQDIGEKDNAVLFTNVSTDVSIQSSGFGTLESGTRRVEFDETFRKVVSGEIPVVVTVSPLGCCNGVYISEIDEDGFTVIENSGGRSDIQFTWIAVGRRAGYETPELPHEVVASDYNDKIARGLHNDGDTQTDGEGLYYEDGELVVGPHPSQIPDPDFIALKEEFSNDPAKRSYSEWESMFGSYGKEIGISEEEYNHQIESNQPVEAFFDEYGNQIPPEWVEELKAEGVEMFSYEQSHEMRKQRYIEKARIERGREVKQREEEQNPPAPAIVPTVPAE